ncbi:MAG: 30S ribosomal protein THX, partial [Gammaproteobacteria bacterium]|nr:30S ribosomal protein THX [Gammaproteobacteria bacterium]
MGEGDVRTRRGKINRGTFGNARPRKRERKASMVAAKMAPTLCRTFGRRVRSSVPFLAVALLVAATEGARGEVLFCYGVGSTTSFARVAYASFANPVGWYGGVGAVRSEFDVGNQTTTSTSVSAGVTFEIGSAAAMGVGAVYQQFEAESEWGGFD